MRRKKRVVITGVGIVSPAGIGKKKFRDVLKKGKSVIKPITLFNTSKMPCKVAGELTSFNARNLLGKKGLRNLNRTTKFALVASKLALDDATLPSPVPDEATDLYGVSFGSAAGNIDDAVDFDLQTLIEGPRSVNPADFPNTSSNIIASYISIRFNIKGFNTTISTSFSSGLDAIFYASNMIKDYGYKVVLAGGAEQLSFNVFTGFTKLGCLSPSKSRKDKEINCPYDKRRNGIVLSEGSCMLILEDFSHAMARNAKIYAEIKGYGFSFDPKILRGSGISADGAAESIRQAMDEAGYSAHEIDCIIGSANSSKRFDAIEAQGIKLALKEKVKEIPVSSIKSIIGETCSVGGAFNAAAAIIAMENGFIPPTINYRFPDRRCDLNIVANKPVKKKLNNILINSFSHEGHNSSLIIGKCER